MLKTKFLLPQTDLTIGDFGHALLTKKWTNIVASFSLHVWFPIWYIHAALFVSGLEKSGTIVKVDNFMTVAKIGLMVLEENM